MPKKDNTNYDHIHCEAPSPASLQKQIVKHQKDGFELVSVVHDSTAKWHAFLKRDAVDWPTYHANRLDEINTGIAMILDNHQGLVTDSQIEDLKSVVDCILEVLETSQKKAK